MLTTTPETAEIEVKVINAFNKLIGQYGVWITDAKEIETMFFKIVTLKTKVKPESFEEIVWLVHAYMIGVQTINNYVEELNKQEEQDEARNQAMENDYMADTIEQEKEEVSEEEERAAAEHLALEAGWAFDDEKQEE